MTASGPKAGTDTHKAATQSMLNALSGNVGRLQAPQQY
jgi:hypothetical protein